MLIHYELNDEISIALKSDSLARRKNLTRGPVKSYGYQREKVNL